LLGCTLRAYVTMSGMAKNEYEQWCEDVYKAIRADYEVREKAGSALADFGGDYQRVGFHIGAEEGKKGAVVLNVTLRTGVGKARGKPLRGNWRSKEENSEDFARKAVLLYLKLRDKYGE
jgi:hypothetical protein